MHSSCTAGKHLLESLITAYTALIPRVPGRAGRGALQHVPPAHDPAAGEAPPPLAAPCSPFPWEGTGLCSTHRASRMASSTDKKGMQ